MHQRAAQRMSDEGSLELSSACLPAEVISARRAAAVQGGEVAGIIRVTRDLDLVSSVEGGTNHASQQLFCFLLLKEGPPLLLSLFPHPFAFSPSRKKRT